jgi:glutamyl-tRNA synthetase
MTIRVRIAPSPTGYLHVGNVRTGLVNWLFAKKHKGEFFLRLDDTDQDRSRPEFAAAIEEDLGWLGLKWDGFFKQSDRYAEYEAAKQKLLANGRLYPCYETAEELEIKRKMMASRGLPPVYDRSALKLTEEQRREYEAQGRKPHYRFLLEDKDIIWSDLIRGDVKFQGAHVSDPVLVREDGVPLYTLASVVDDIEYQITHIIRGEDHVSNTAVQIQIFEALGGAPPSFGHLALLKTKEGELSKRKGGGDIRGLRDEGFEPMTINSYLGKIGTSDAIEPFASLDALVASFDMKKFGRAPANYDPAEVDRLNEKLLTHMPFDQAKSCLASLGLNQVNEAFWNSVHGNIKKMSDVSDWWKLIHEPVKGIIDDADFIATAAALLPPEPWNENSWNEWTNAVKEKTGKKGKDLFMPLRKALTGMEHGPEMKVLFMLLGRNKVLERLK